MRPVVVLFNPMLHPAGHEWLVARADVELVPQGTSPSGLIEAVARADAALVRPPVRMTRALIASAPYLQVIGTEGTGYDQIDVTAATDAGIPVIHNVGIGAAPVAEHTVGLMLALARRIVQGNDLLRRDGWSSRASFFGSEVGTELTSKTLGIVGFGQIGRRVASICHTGFGMRIVAYTRSPGEARAQAPEVDFRADLHSVVADADFLTVHTPLNESTRHLIGAAELALMKPSAFLINCARGPVVDQVALVAALRDRRIAGAALDVFEPEPADLSDLLFSQHHVVVTPHIAALSEETNRLLALGAAQQIMQVLDGTQPARLVNPEVWVRRRLGGRRGTGR